MIANAYLKNVSAVQGSSFLDSQVAETLHLEKINNKNQQAI